MGYGLWTMDYGLWTMVYEIWDLLGTLGPLFYLGIICVVYSF